MTSGQSIACERNDSNPVNPNTEKSICHQKVDNIFHQLQRRHISWADWQESMPHPCAFYDDGTSWAGDVYGAHHNPAIYYDDIEGNRYVEDFNTAQGGLSPPRPPDGHHWPRTTPGASTEPWPAVHPAVQLRRPQRLRERPRPGRQPTHRRRGSSTGS